MIVRSAAALVAALSFSSPSVSSDTLTVYAMSGGKNVPVLHACKNERFYPGVKGSDAAPKLSPDGKWLLVTRVFPYEPQGRVDQSTLLLDTTTGHAYASSFFGKRLGAGRPILETWVGGKPETLSVLGSSGTRRVALSGPLKGVAPPDRCG